MVRLFLDKHYGSVRFTSSLSDCSVEHTVIDIHAKCLELVVSRCVRVAIDSRPADLKA